MGFKKTVLMVALTIFLGVLIITALVIKNSYKNAIFPPEVAQCPDYWEPNGTDELKKQCKATDNNRGTYEISAVTDDLAFDTHGITGRVAKCKWAVNNNVQWDGITNTNLC